MDNQKPRSGRYIPIRVREAGWARRVGKDPEDSLAKGLRMGPVGIRIQLHLEYPKCSLQLEKSWTAICYEPKDVKYIRQRLRDLKRELNGLVVMEEAVTETTLTIPK